MGAFAKVVGGHVDVGGAVAAVGVAAAHEAGLLVGVGRTLTPRRVALRPDGTGETGCNANTCTHITLSHSLHS